ncbi:uncharacterized protein [Anabrus simplex]|uniref:uncharacterized protein n=1 Tax=Anabrus simplex TaxID=316456 RepID=UPI0034DD78B4
MRTRSLLVSVWAIIWGALLSGVTAVGDVVVQEVAVGSTAELPCPSSDDGHRFQFWQLHGNQVLGPGNEIDRAKYRYDVLTGKLAIKAISSTEAGFYTCVSKGLANAAFNSKSVELVVKKDWEDVYENDYETNLFRGLIAMGVLIILLIFGIVFYTLRRHRIVSFRDMTDEESPDEMPQGGTYNVSNLPTMGSGITPNSHGIDNPSLETDFPRVFNTIQKTNDSQI